jgi:hypothetical protein
MSSYIGAELRRLVETRAGARCEYCLIHEADTYSGCEVDHIISEKHGGPTAAENLAYSCMYCNRLKGSDIASIASRTGQIVRLFNPRTDRWSDHFVLNGAVIRPLSDVGEATATLLGFNRPERVDERALLQAAGRYSIQ